MVFLQQITKIIQSLRREAHPLRLAKVDRNVVRIRVAARDAIHLVVASIRTRSAITVRAARASNEAATLIEERVAVVITPVIPCHY